MALLLFAPGVSVVQVLNQALYPRSSSSVIAGINNEVYRSDEELKVGGNVTDVIRRHADRHEINDAFSPCQSLPELQWKKGIPNQHARAHTQTKKTTNKNFTKFPSFEFEGVQSSKQLSPSVPRNTNVIYDAD